MKPKRCKIPGPFVVYMLHLPHAVAPLHYVGITTPARLDARMREHVAGRGAGFTALACRLGLPWSLAATWETEDRSTEKKIAGLRPASGVCPICRGSPAIRSYIPTKMAAPTQSGHNFEGFNLATQVRERPTLQPMEKEAQQMLAPSSRHFGQT